jgi:hypothetical protein
MLGFAERVRTLGWFVLGGVLAAVALIGARPHGRAVALIGYVERDSLSPDRHRFVMLDELGSRPPISVIVPGDLDKLVCSRAHRDVYVEGWLEGDRLLAISIIPFNDHRYDRWWAERCFRSPPDDVLFR